VDQGNHNEATSIFSTVLRRKLISFGCSRSLVHLSSCSKIFFYF
jgi:hypothetical protein